MFTPLLCHAYVAIVVVGIVSPRYHGFPSSLRPAVIAVVLSKAVFQLYARPDGSKEMMVLHTTQHCLRLLNDDAMKVTLLDQSPTISTVVVVHMVRPVRLRCRQLSVCAPHLRRCSGLGSTDPNRHQPNSVSVCSPTRDTRVRLRLCISIRVCRESGLGRRSRIRRRLLGPIWC